MIVEETILLFREYANQVLNEQNQRLKEYDKSYLLSGKLARLKFFNTHLKILKEEINNRIIIILSEHAGTPYYNKLKKELQDTATEYINEYLFLGFYKEK
jgi:hypothetical protein